MSAHRPRELVLALYPFTRGLAFTLFEEPLSPIDWGVKDLRGDTRNARSLDAAKQLIDRLQPDVVVLESCSGPDARRSQRILRLQRLITNYASGQAVEIHSFSRRQIRKCFQNVGAATRYEIAQSIAARVDAFGHRLPPVRKIWMSEPSRMALFDAASIAMTYYCRDRRSPGDEAGEKALRS
jgi:Holliday junction resolvasome RuvABC endonuclease subunit